MDYLNQQKQMEQEVLSLIKKYNVLYKRQLYAFFENCGKDGRVGRALKALGKDNRIYINPVTRMVAANENSYAAREYGTLQAVWVLISLMKQKKIEEHFLAAKDEFPVRIIFVVDAEIYDILYIPESDVELVNNLFARKRIECCGHVAAVESAEYIHRLRIPDVLGFCTVEEDGKIEYYKQNL